MANLPNINLDISSSENGLACQVDLNLSLLLPKLQKRLDFDLQPMVTSFLLWFIRLQIKDLEKTIASKKILNFSFAEDELRLTSLKDNEQKLKTYNHD